MLDLQGIAVGHNQDGRLELVATTNDTSLSPAGSSEAWRRLHTEGGGWSQWASLDIPIGWGFGGPAIARNKDDRLEIALTAFGKVLHAWQTAPNGQKWRHASLDQPPWGSPDSRIAPAPPALAENKDGRLEVFALGSRATYGSIGALWHIWQRRQGGWSPWHSLETPDQVSLWGDPAVARNRDGGLEVFMRGDHALWHIWQRRQGGWSQWASLKGLPSGDFSEWAVGAHADGRLVVFAVADPPSGSSPGEPGEPNALWQREQAVAGRWSPWRSFTRSGPLTVAGPALALDAHRQLQLWLRIPGRVDLYRLKQTEPNGSEWEDRWDALQPPRPSPYIPQPAGSPPAPPD